MSAVLQLGHTVRAARKPYWCGMCNASIKVGDRHSVSTNVYDGRAYDWRECLPCDRDGIVSLVHDWSGGYWDEGVNYENASEWADEVIGGWFKRPAERAAARRWLARAAGGEGE